ncbi:cysteine sulfinate desulfinase [Pseudidiomarina maritima]|uniref:Cysteine sulfinate desulfinase n=1 Tax=Pseudidiomarina maritima TaxID=519453 RepID=A0A1I6GJF5_9GAMM|nr:aminotransferase class V-fold PLP-dependent enzyme [Pseudidiomarina maritima]SFR42345.1 cysteine sulfinate desulfinase [Pseudidiomarina maritima]
MSQFALLRQHPELIYFDSAATCQVPDVVLQAYTDYYQQHHANVHRASHQLGRAATTALETARAKLAEFIGASAEQIALVASTTAALNGLAEQLPVQWQAGDEILLSSAEHHANILPWQRLAKQHELTLRYIPIDSETGELGEWRELLTPRTRVVSVTAASNITGTVFHLQPLLQAAKAQGTWTLVDAAQAAAHVPIEVHQLECDALVFSMHKLYSVNGCAVLYIRDALRDAMAPFLVGGGIVQRVSATDAELIDGIHKFEAGSPNTAAAVAAATAVDWLQQQHLQRQLVNLRQQLLEQLQQRAWLTVLPSGAQATPTISFYSDEFQAFDIAAWLDQHHIAVRAGHHCAQLLLQQWQLPAVVRISLGAYNTADQINRFLETLDAGWALFGSD